MKRQLLQKQLRKKIIELAATTKSGHPHLGSCLSCIDILNETFLGQMKPRDKFILSKGHASLALYVVLNYQKKISDAQLKTYFKEGTDFGIHPPSTFKKHIPLATGSLGHGLSFAAGMALGYRYKNPKNPRRVYCLMSDGECNEGSVWEAAQFISHHKLENLFTLIDKNKIQAFGRIDEVLGDAASIEKWSAFGFNVISCDGHNLLELHTAFEKLKKMKNDKPPLIICNTVRGKGISQIEDKIISNYMPVDKILKKQALSQLKKI